jgi:3-hydroxyisobutyrate dehydrogenase-like beta-hydroxyacid dehydrogenase
MRVAVIGLGEAGAAFAADLVVEGIDVSAFDPGAVPTPTGVVRCVDEAAAVARADIVLVVTGPAEVPQVFDAILDVNPATALVADLSTSAPVDKAERAARATAHGCGFVDVALMTPVPGRGLRTPSIVSGPGAESYAAALRPLGVPIDIVGDRAGDASTRKLLRSVTMKGLAAIVIEAVQAAERAGVAEWLWSDLVAEMEAADAGLLERLLRGTGVHAQRRVHEMEASAALLSSLGVEPVMTRATIEALRQAARHGVPDVPGQPKS